MSECHQCPTDQVGGGSPTAPDLAVGEVPAGAGGGGDPARSGSRRSDPDLVQAVAAFVDELVDEAPGGAAPDDGGAASGPGPDDGGAVSGAAAPAPSVTPDDEVDGGVDGGVDGR